MQRDAAMTRRTFVGTMSAALLSPLGGAHAAARAAGETLYNGIVLGTPWPPPLIAPNELPIRPPYLAQPPDVIPIDLGRQLFVDDFLIEETTLRARHHRAEYHASSPVLRPERPWEVRDEYADRTKTPPNPTAMVFSDGVFFDPSDRRFKMWYMGGYSMSTCYAESDDGIAWRRPVLDIVKGTNIVFNEHRDSSTVWLDRVEADRARRYKMAVWHDFKMSLHVSPDGIHWQRVGETGYAGDRTTFFYNPFRRVWVFGIRAGQTPTQDKGRYRSYWETPDFLAARGWNGRTPTAWVKADSRDYAQASIDTRPELYNLDCVAYESVMLGLFTIWRGESLTREKINEVTVGFSRDGFHWHRPDRRAFIGVSDQPGSWNYANVQSAGGCCLVVGDRLYFYVSGRQGAPNSDRPGVCSTGLATLRRDGFTSMDWLPDEAPVVRLGSRGQREGTLTTRPVRFGGRYLFVNADTRGGVLNVEVLDRSGRALAPFTREECVGVNGNATQMPVRWRRAADLSALAGQDVRFRFTLERGSLFAFWVSPSPAGESGGYPAAGGPAVA